MPSSPPARPSTPMVASRDGLFLLGVSCASLLLSSAVGITSECLDHFMHLTFRSARIIAQRSTLTRPWPTARYAARFAALRRAAAVARRRLLCGSSISFAQCQCTTQAARTHNTHKFWQKTLKFNGIRSILTNIGRFHKTAVIVCTIFQRTSTQKVWYL